MEGKKVILLYAADIVIMSETEEGLHKGVLLLEKYCASWTLRVNCIKTKVVICRKGEGLDKI